MQRKDHSRDVIGGFRGVRVLVGKCYRKKTYFLSFWAALPLQPFLIGNSKCCQKGFFLAFCELHPHSAPNGEKKITRG